MDPSDGVSNALRQGAGGDRQQARPAAVGDAGHDETYDADAWLQHPMVQRPAGKHAITVAAMA